MTGRLIYLILIIFTLNAFYVHAQEKKIVQFSGLISSVGGELPVPFVTLTNKSFNNQVFMANNEGYFTFVAHVGDTILFTSVGFDPTKYIIPEINGDKHTVQINMRSLVIELPAIVLYPWASIEEFNQAFLALDVSNEDLSRIKRNISPQALAALAASVPRSAAEIQTYNSMQRHINMTNKNINQRYANPLLSPFAWGSLINSIVQGDYSRKRLKY